MFNCVCFHSWSFCWNNKVSNLGISNIWKNSNQKHLIPIQTLDRRSRCPKARRALSQSPIERQIRAWQHQHIYQLSAACYKMLCMHMYIRAQSITKTCSCTIRRCHCVPTTSTQSGRADKTNRQTNVAEQQLYAHTEHKVGPLFWRRAHQEAWNRYQSPLKLVCKSRIWSSINATSGASRRQFAADFRLVRRVFVLKCNIALAEIAHVRGHRQWPSDIHRSK